MGFFFFFFLFLFQPFLFGPRWRACNTASCSTSGAMKREYDQLHLHLDTTLPRTRRPSTDYSCSRQGLLQNSTRQHARTHVGNLQKRSAKCLRRWSYFRWAGRDGTEFLPMGIWKSTVSSGSVMNLMLRLFFLLLFYFFFL